MVKRLRAVTVCPFAFLVAFAATLVTLASVDRAYGADPECICYYARGPEPMCCRGYWNPLGQCVVPENQDCWPSSRLNCPPPCYYRIP